MYIGVTNNLKRRMYEHKNKLVEGFTKKYNVNKLVYYENIGDAICAIKREKQLKNGHGKRKIDLWKVKIQNGLNLKYEESIKYCHPEPLYIVIPSEVEGSM